jgi:hypothetical protein
MSVAIASTNIICVFVLLELEDLLRHMNLFDFILLILNLLLTIIIIFCTIHIILLLKGFHYFYLFYFNAQLLYYLERFIILYFE